MSLSPKYDVAVSRARAADGFAIGVPRPAAVVCSDTGRAVEPRRCDRRITERSNADGVIVFDWTCVGCAFAFGFGYPTREICEAMSAHHVAPEAPAFSDEPMRIVRHTRSA